MRLLDRLGIVVVGVLSLPLVAAFVWFFWAIPVIGLHVIAGMPLPPCYAWVFNA